MNGLQLFAVFGWGLAGLMFANWRIERKRKRPMFEGCTISDSIIAHGQLSEEEKQALVSVLSLAENSQIWTSPMIGDEMKAWRDECYEHIQIVRAFLKENGVMTLHEFTKQAAERQHGTD